MKEKEGGGRRKGAGRGWEGGKGEKILMTMMVITDINVMMTIKMIVAMVLMITCGVDEIDDGGDGDGGNNNEGDNDDDNSSKGNDNIE